jgi:polyhydroxybutyrate depolymerase
LPVSVVLAFHGRFGTGKAFEKLSKLDDVADRNGFIVVYPDGVGGSWNAGHGDGAAEHHQVNDVAFVSALIDELGHTFAIDPARVHAVGISNGGMFAQRLGCELSDKIASIATVAGPIPTNIAQNCHPRRPISVLVVHGTADPIVLWEGKIPKGKGKIESVPATIRHWVKHNECTTTPTITDLGGGVTREVCSPCQGGTEVILYRIDHGGHTWPGGRQYLPRLLIGETNQTFRASEAVWEFFVAHPLEPLWELDSD